MRSIPRFRLISVYIVIPNQFLSSITKDVKTPIYSIHTSNHQKAKENAIIQSLQIQACSLNVGLVTLRHIAVCDFLDELGIRVEEHDVEVFHRMNRLQGSPVLE